MIKTINVPFLNPITGVIGTVPVVAQVYKGLAIHNALNPEDKRLCLSHVTTGKFLLCHIDSTRIKAVANRLAGQFDFVNMDTKGLENKSFEIIKFLRNTGNSDLVECGESAFIESSEDYDDIYFLLETYKVSHLGFQFVIYNLDNSPYKDSDVISLYENYCNEEMRSSYYCKYVITIKNGVGEITDMPTSESVSYIDVDSFIMKSYATENLSSNTSTRLNDMPSISPKIIKPYVRKENVVITGNLLNITEGVIIHQLNNQHVMGKGIALDIKNKYHQHFLDYRVATNMLGTIVTTRITTKPFFGIIGMIAQDGYGTTGLYTRYDAFEECLEQIHLMHDKSPHVRYYMPYNIGCNLGGGSWKRISKLIYEICPFITIIKL